MYCSQRFMGLFEAYFSRIMEVNHQGAKLHAVVETNPRAMEQAAALDLERKIKGKRSALHGIPILVKDNIATLHEEGTQCRLLGHKLTSGVVGMNTTAGWKELVAFSIHNRDLTILL